MRLVMLGYFGFGNAGDEAVLAAEVAALRAELGADLELVVVSGDPAHTRRVHGLDAVSRSDLPAVLRTVRRSDGLVAGGGSLLQDVTSARPVTFYAGVMLAARASRRPVFVYAQGLGPVRRRANQLLAARALRAATRVFLRDQGSIELARSWGVDDVEFAPDPVLGLEIPASAGSGAAGSGGSGSAGSGSAGSAGPGGSGSAGSGSVSLSGSGSSGGEGIAVALRPWRGQEEWLPGVSAGLKDAAAEVGVVVVPFHPAQDGEVARVLADSLGSGARIAEVDDGFRPAVTAVGAARAVLGMRLHALIAAVAARRPFAALSYDPKVDALAAQVGAPVVARLPGEVDPDRLRSTLRTLLTAPAPEPPPGDPRAPARAIAEHFASEA